MAQKRLSFSIKPDGIDEADAVFIAVGTPSRRGDGHADLSYIYSAVREIAPLPGPSQTSSVGLRSLGSSRLR